MQEIKNDIKTTIADKCTFYGLELSDMIIDSYSDYLNSQVSTTEKSFNTLDSSLTHQEDLTFNNSTHEISPSSMTTITEDYNPEATKIKNHQANYQMESILKNQEEHNPDEMERERIDKNFAQVNEPDNKLKKFRRAKEFNELLCLLDSILQTNNIDPRCPTGLDCKKCKELAITCNTNIEATQHREESILKECIKFDPVQGNFCVPLPLKDDPDVALGENAEQAKSFYRRVVNKLSKAPEDKKAIIKSFNKQIE